MCSTFGLPATVLLSIGVFFLGSTFMEQMSMAETTATIIDFVDDRGDRYPYVTYEVNGKQYEDELIITDSSLKAGDKIRIRYDPYKPNIAQPTDFDTLLFTYFHGILFTAIGLPFALITVMVAIFVFKSSNRISESEEDDKDNT